MQIAAYAPLADATFAPDVVVFRGNARQLMLLSEAARSAGIFGGGDILGRPACAMIPHAGNTGGAVASFGCIGNRVYTGLADDEFYVTVPGNGLAPTLDRLAVILNANTQLKAFHEARNQMKTCRMQNANEPLCILRSHSSFRDHAPTRPCTAAAPPG